MRRCCHLVREVSGSPKSVGEPMVVREGAADASNGFAATVRVGRVPSWCTRQQTHTLVEILEHGVVFRWRTSCRVSEGKNAEDVPIEVHASKAESKVHIGATTVQTDGQNHRLASWHL